MKTMMMRMGAAAIALCATAAVTSASAAEGSAPQAISAERAPKASRALLTAVVRAGDSLVAVGSRGHILSSADGVSWTQAEVPVNVLLTAVAFADARNGWAVGHDATVLHTQDGGATWQLQNFHPGENALLDVLFLDPQRGFAIGAYGLLLRTTDGGRNWIRIEDSIAAEGLHLNAMTRLNDGSLFIVGEQGMMARSTDDGASWQRLQSPYESSLFAVAARGASGAVVGGLRGNAFQTADVAASAWTRIDNDSVQSIFGITDLGDGSFAFAGLNGTLQTLANDEHLRTVALDRAAANLDAPPPQAPPFVPVKSESRDVEVGAFSRAVPWKDGLLTVGDAGAHFWKRR